MTGHRPIKNRKSKIKNVIVPVLFVVNFAPRCLVRKEGPLPTSPSSASPRQLSNFSCALREKQLSECRKGDKGKVKLALAAGANHDALALGCWAVANGRLDLRLEPAAGKQ
jgi:hypothetical protein